MTAGNDRSAVQRNRAVMVVVLWAVTAVVLTFVIGTSFCQSESSDGFEQERRYMVTTQVSERGGTPGNTFRHGHCSDFRQCWSWSVVHMYWLR